MFLACMMNDALNFLTMIDPVGGLRLLVMILNNRIIGKVDVE